MHPLGKAGVTYVERGQYLRAIERDRSQLATLGASAVAREINEQVIPGLISGGERLTVPVTNVDFMGRGRYRSIAFILDALAMDAERKHVTDWLDKKNGLNTYWDEFEAHVSSQA